MLNPLLDNALDNVDFSGRQWRSDFTSAGIGAKKDSCCDFTHLGHSGVTRAAAKQSHAAVTTGCLGKMTNGGSLQRCGICRALGHVIMQLPG
jgi:hypothetical protein